MSKKTQSDHPADDWAGLAQNLFGINLDKPSGDDDLLDDDMFKVELPQPPEPQAPILQSEVEFAPSAEPGSPNTTEASQPAPKPAVAAKPVKKAAPPRVVTTSVGGEDEPFGFGVLEPSEISAAAPTVECSTEKICGDDASASEDLTLLEEFDAEGLTLASDDDDGLTLPDDHDVEGLTLPADYDDGLTLAPENIDDSEEDDREEEEGDEEEEDDTQVLPAGKGEVGEEARSDSRRRRHPRRTREDAYWDMLENWEWEEIPDDDSPRGEGERPRFQRGDRGDRRGGRGGDRGRRDRGREDRPRSEVRSGSEGRPRSEDRPPRDEQQRSADAASSSGRESGERTARPPRGGRSREDRSPREDRPRSEHRRDRDEPQRSVPPSQPTSSAGISEDFGFGIFEDQPQPVATSSVLTPVVPTARPPREESVAQSSQAADAVLRDTNRPSGRSVADDLVWPDDDSDVRPAPSGSVVETSGLPAADAAGESDQMMLPSDVEAIEEDDDSLRRPRRRRRRRGGPRSETSAPPDGNEGTTFDLSEALANESETPDFIPSAIADDSAVSDERSDVSSERDTEEATEEDRSSEHRGGRRRRRRRRPGEGPKEATVRPEAESSKSGGEIGAAEASEEDEYVVKPIAYSNIPSWEEAIKYLLQPHLVGRNLGPDDEDESLENDPRGSGGAEPTSPPPPPRRRGGRGGRGRRP